MVRFEHLQIYLILAITSLPLNCLAISQWTRGFCATAPPNESLKTEFRRLNALESQHDPTLNPESREAVTPIEIETWFHIVSTEANAGQVSDEMISAQLSYIQNAYQNATISYSLQGVTQQINDAWARNEDEMGMKNALRKGSYRTLNIYFQSDLKASPSAGSREADITQQLASSVLGFCTLPDANINKTSPRSSYVKDGCNVLSQTMPGGNLDHYNRGGTAIHEIGHWNGLLHTFEGESCSPDNEGDYISDTPQEGVPTDGCPSQKDSCPDRPGVDPIHNFMDYSSDECYENFTPAQIKRMRSMWFSMRSGK
ncbi:hypothetical protein P175DRAFT_0509452 [Aspergillus ochraceoroseus IBT 24754]|uniref:Peptidase M43 pregnancy-associated plasma-A domain-containing protein n=3 Tax=Aspergillus subgen. Nidulantes TaxID=2720870 RepID=A0A0F8XKQ7_9EURO|nr:uncharacterized protein P175DRAFT_0509452 [Aspergillus ochraceoroseus IBT 24754]KKK24132.1 hypothetical protein ARAM_005142 [Aspergillus rambellii]KKK24590.1 hypothetical protein AOCH_002961 [Aspergillus ochraceoroseus]PTU20946.1 hypothetical protein P175DRAFT_0509452 [Aspergillus ochraceoroseus IBT 24754]